MLPLKVDVRNIDRELHCEDERVQPAVLVAHADHEPSLAIADRLQIVEVRTDVMLATCVSHSEKHPVWLIEGAAVHRRPGTHWELHPDFEMLVLWQDLPRTGLATVVNPVVAVPPCPPPAELD